MTALIPLALLLAQEGGFELNTGPIRFRGAELRGQYVRASDVETDLPYAEEREGNVFNVTTSRLDFGDVEYDGQSLGVALDFDVVRLSAEGHWGDWEGEGVLTFGDTLGPTTRMPVDLEGEWMGLRFGAEWAALRYAGETFEASLGPALGVNWYRFAFDDVAASPLKFDEEPDALVGSLGPRLRLRAVFDRFFVTLEAESSYLFDSLEGREDRLGLSVGLRF